LKALISLGFFHLCTYDTSYLKLKKIRDIGNARGAHVKNGRVIGKLVTGDMRCTWPLCCIININRREK
jgi:hypothetical protein